MASASRSRDRMSWQRDHEKRERGLFGRVHCCGETIRTSDLRVMSPSSYRCSTPRTHSTSIESQRRTPTTARSRRSLIHGASQCVARLPVALHRDERLVRTDVSVVARLLLHVVGGLLIRDLRLERIVLRLIGDEIAAVARDLASDCVALDGEADECRRKDETRQCERHRGEVPTEANTPRPPTMPRAHARIMRYE